MLRSQFLAATSAAGGATTVAQISGVSVATTTIGVAVPLSGRDMHLGEKVADGVRQGIQDANNLRSSLDRAYVMRTFDDTNTVASAIVNAQFATGDSTVVATIGHLGGRTTTAAIPTYAAAQMALIVPLATDDSVTANNFHNVFRLQTKDSVEGRLFAQYVASRFSPKSTFTLVQDGDYGGNVASGFVDEMVRRKVGAPFLTFSWDKPDFAAVAAHVVAANPDFVFLAGIVRDMGGVIAALRAQGYSGPLGASQGFFDAPTAALGPNVNDMVISTSIPYLPLAPSALRAKTSFEAHYGPMSPLSLFGYAAAQIVIATVQRTAAYVRNSFLSALASSGPIDTIAGTFAFDPLGDPRDPEIYFYTIRDGKFSYLKQAHPSPFMMK
jgi:branched-chain amino acid transport system substrate-binding protein